MWVSHEMKAQKERAEGMWGREHPSKHQLCDTAGKRELEKKEQYTQSSQCDSELQR